jgi:hypothetical protein
MKPLEPGESWAAKTPEQILTDIKRAQQAMAEAAAPVVELKILRNPYLPPGTMVVSDDVFKLLEAVPNGR